MTDVGGKESKGRKGGQKMPWQLILAAIAWAALGVTSLLTALGGGGGTGDADSGSVGKVQGSLGDSAASVGEGGGANAAILVIIGLAALLLTGMVLLGQAWARLALSVIGAIAVIYFALTVGMLETFVAMVALVVGSVLLLLPASVNSYLKG